MPVEEAAAVIWTLTSPEVHRMLTVDWAWTSPRYEDWLRTTLQTTLLPDPPDGAVLAPAPRRRAARRDQRCPVSPGGRWP